MSKVSRRRFLKGALAGMFGAGLTWAGAVRAEEEPKEGLCAQEVNEPDPAEQAAMDDDWGLTFGPIPLHCGECGREAQEGEVFTSCVLCEYDVSGWLICPECQGKIDEVRDRAILETEQLMVEMQARLSSLNKAAHEAAGKFDDLEPIIEGLTMGRRPLWEPMGPIASGYLDEHSGEPCGPLEWQTVNDDGSVCPGCAEYTTSTGYKVPVHNLLDPRCQAFEFKQGALANGSVEWSIEPAKRGANRAFGDQTRLYVASPDKPGEFNYVDDVYEFKLDDVMGSEANIEDLPGEPFTLEPNIRGCNNWRMVHGVPVCEDDAMGIRVDGKGVVSGPVHAIGDFRADGVAWRFDENRAKVPVSINEVHRFKALDGVEPTWSWGHVSAGADALLWFDGQPKHVKNYRYATAADGWTLTVTTSYLMLLGESVRWNIDGPDKKSLFSEKGFVRSVARDLSEQEAVYTYEIVDPFAFFTAMLVDAPMWRECSEGEPWRTEVAIAQMIDQIAAKMGPREWFCVGTGPSSFARIQGGMVEVGDTEGGVWTVHHAHPCASVRLFFPLIHMPS